MKWIKFAFIRKVECTFWYKNVLVASFIPHENDKKLCKRCIRLVSLGQFSLWTIKTTVKTVTHFDWIPRTYHIKFMKGRVLKRPIKVKIHSKDYYSFSEDLVDFFCKVLDVVKFLFLRRRCKEKRKFVLTLFFYSIWKKWCLYMKKYCFTIYCFLTDFYIILDILFTSLNKTS